MKAKYNRGEIEVVLQRRMAEFISDLVDDYYTASAGSATHHKIEMLALVVPSIESAASDLEVYLTAEFEVEVTP